MKSIKKRIKYRMATKRNGRKAIPKLLAAEIRASAKGPNRVVQKYRKPQRSAKNARGLYANPEQAFGHHFDNEEQAIHDWMATVLNPWTETPARVPSTGFGDYCLQTLMAQQKFEGSATCNASGFCFVGCAADGWVSSTAIDSGVPVTAGRYASYSGGTPGYPVGYSDANYVGTALPIPSFGGAGLNIVPMPLIDGMVNPLTHIRNVSVGLEVWCDSSLTNTAGSVMIVSTIREIQDSVSGGLASATTASLLGVNDEIMSRKEAPAAALISGKTLKACAIPHNQTSLTMVLPLATGAAVPYLYNVAAILYGAASGAKLHWRATYNYEFEFQQSHLTGLATRSNVAVPAHRLANARPIMLESATRMGDVADPDENGTGTGAYLSTLPPAKAKAIATQVARGKVDLGSLISKGVKSLSASGILGKIPVVGPFLGPIAELIGDLF